MKTAAFHTLGCKVNQYDTQAMLEKFRAAGYEIVPFDADADVYVINTCTVTGTGDKKSLQLARRLRRKHPDSALILAGCLAQRKPEDLLETGARLVIGTQHRGEVVELLEKALRDFGVKTEGCVCSDSGASTGGFTDCLLQHGAKKVFAIDVGYGQLDWKIRSDPRVVVMERTNIRNVTLDMLAEPIEFFSVDVSFISLHHIFPVAQAITTPDAMGVCLVKPQFEAGREKVGKNGVVRDPATHREVLHNAMGYAAANGFKVCGLDFSPVKGPEGNIEYLMFVQKSDEPGALDDSVAEQVVASSHYTLDR